MEVELTSTQEPNSPSTEPVNETAALSTSTESPSVSSHSSANSQTNGQEAQGIPAYQPNFKFSVLKKEHEIPELYRSVVKDADSEKQVKELFEKAYGLDHVKSERAKLQDEYKTYKTQTEPILKIASQLEYHRKQGDLGGYFKTLGLSREQIFQWAVQQAEIEQLPEHQRRVYDQQQEAQLRAYQLEQQLQERDQQFQAYQVQQRQAELDFTLSKPDVSSFAQAFDQRNGEGSFRDELIQRGRMYYFSQGIDVPPEKLAQEIMTRFHLQTTSPNQTTQPVQTQPVPAQPQRTTQSVPVIPNTGASASAPVKKKVTSLEDIEREYQEYR